MMPILLGFAIGLAMILFVGPVVFTLLSVTLNHGKKTGFFAATGIMVSDVIAVTLCSLSFSTLFEQSQFQLWISIIGSVLLIGFGLNQLFFLKKLNPQKQSLLAQVSSGFASGFWVNFLNPFVFLVWLGIIAKVNAVYSNQTDVALFLIGSIAGVYTVDMFKVVLVQKAKLLLKKRALINLQRACGILNIGFGIRLTLVELY